MTAHASLLLVGALDLVVLLLLGGAAVTAARVLLGWEPQQASEAQLRLEARVDLLSLQTRIGLGLFAGSTLVLLVAVSSVLPGLVPGAMCGTGAMQAMEGEGGRALWLRAMAFGILALWALVDRLDRSHPESPLILLGSRIQLLAAPVVVLAVLATFSALGALQLQRAVDCCAVVYDQLRGTAAGFDPASAYSGAVTCAFFAIAAALVTIGLLRWRAQGPLPGRLEVVFAALALGFVPVASMALLHTFAPYHYGVLSHRCPWCLFLLQHRAVGFPLLAALAAVVIEGVAALVAARIAAREPRVSDQAWRRARSAGLRLAVVTSAFVLLAAGPALLWRLRFGVWMR